MKLSLISDLSGLMQQEAVSDIVKCNAYTQNFGLVLTQAQATELAQTHTVSLQENGRIAFGGGILERMIKLFADSPYLYTQNYVQTLHELTQLFYAYKNATLDLISDDDLLSFMKSAFDGVCQGSLDLLSGRELYRLEKNLRFGLSANDSEDDFEEKWEETDE